MSYYSVFLPLLANIVYKKQVSINELLSESTSNMSSQNQTAFGLTVLCSHYHVAALWPPRPCHLLKGAEHGHVKAKSSMASGIYYFD